MWFPPEDNSTEYVDYYDNDLSTDTWTNKTSGHNMTEAEEISSYHDFNGANNGIGLERRFFYVYYTTADETEFSSDRLIDFATFVGSVGGTLGLYLGFSFLGMFFPLYEQVEKMTKKWMLKN